MNLISKKREGTYWDFKEKPYECLASLLHDIICLSNASHQGERYLIIGVEDGTGKIIGLNKNQDNRKTQGQYINFLSKQLFAGENRPEIELETIYVQGVKGDEIDVLVIYNHPLKPYYLTQDFRRSCSKGKPKIIKANYIYTRVIDTNTPIDRSADIGIIEKMWKERFGLETTPFKRMKQFLLNPSDWFINIETKSYAYHNEFPEFKIEFSKTRPFWEIYSYFFPNESSYLGDAKFIYHSTILFELEYMFCDEFRLILPVPKSQYIKLGKNDNWYYYFDLSKVNGIFLQFLSDRLTKFSSRGATAPFLIFRNTEERELFNDYVVTNSDLLQEIDPGAWAQKAKKMMVQNKKPNNIDPIFIDKILQLKEKWDWD